MYSIGVDKNRVLVKEASIDRINGKWKDVVGEIIDTCKKHLGSHLISIYIGGSVAHGAGIENKSDVDTYVIVDLGKEEIWQVYESWVNDEIKRINAAHPFQRGVEMHLLAVDQLAERRKFQMKVFSALVLGKDLGPEISEYKLDRETVAKIRVRVKKDIEKARKEIEDSEGKSVEMVKDVTSRIAKRLIRNAGMMCMWQENFFTMDIATLVELVSTHYPEKRAELGQLYDCVENPSSSMLEITMLLDSFGDWLISEDERIFMGV